MNLSESTYVLWPISNSSSSQTVHQDTTIQNINRCGICSQLFTRKISLGGHISRYHPKH
ncbi:unnamed protein product [Paramecium sonneborni]|uniref:C2H2-type domain-containing protein n=1 Tax=Paramecium sonneborni TaxID=65129 RepID=A0A8S1PFQ3_9CILI|nr:unnamed protein product [Paramecium sonneborni]